MEDKKDKLTIHEKWEIDSKQGLKFEDGPEAEELARTGTRIEIEDRTKLQNHRKSSYYKK